MDLRSYRQMKAEERVALIKKVSDLQAEEAARIRKELEDTEKAISRGGAPVRRSEGRRAKYEAKAPRKFSLMSNEGEETLRKIAKTWNVSMRGLMRLAIYSMAKEYGFPTKGILNRAEEKAIVRDRRARRPFTRADGKSIEDIWKPIDPTVANAEGPSRVYEAGGVVGPEIRVSW